MEVAIKGNLTNRELLELLQKVRDIEQHDPKREFKIVGNFPELTVDELKDIYRQVKPPLPYIWVGRYPF
jgi:hypothetical protein